MTMTATDTGPRIYVADLAAYNAGRLHGRWIDATQDAESIHQEIRDMLAGSPVIDAEEFAIHDYEGFCGIEIHEYETIEHVAELAALLAEHGPAYAAYRDYVGADHATAADFEEAYAGEWESEEAFAEELIEDIGELKADSLAARYFDYEKFARDLFMSDYWSADASEYGEDSGLYIFRSY